MWTASTNGVGGNPGGGYDDRSGVSSFAMLLRGYRADVWWWEATVVGRKVAFAALAVLVDDAAAQTALAAALLFCLFGAQLHQRPFVDSSVNNGEALSLLTLFMTRVLYIIDVSQSVEHDHPRSLEFLRMDCHNVTAYFRKQRQLAPMSTPVGSCIGALAPIKS